MKILKYVLSCIISFLIMLMIFVILLINILDNKLLDKNYILQKMDESEFYLQVSREVESGFENYIYQSGLPEETIQDLFTDEMIENDVKTIVDCLYEGTEIKLSDNTLKETLHQRIEEYLESQNKKLNEQGEKSIEKFENLIVEEYRKNVNVSTTLFVKGNQAIEKMIEVRNQVGSWHLIILVILITILVLLNIKDLLSAVNFIAIASLSGGVLLKLGTNLIFNNIDFENLLIMSTSLSNLISAIIKECLYNISDYSNVFMVCGIIGIFEVAFLKRGNRIIKPIRRHKRDSKHAE